MGESETRERVLSGCSAPPILCFFSTFFSQNFIHERTNDEKFFRFAAKTNTFVRKEKGKREKLLFVVVRVKFLLFLTRIFFSSHI